MKRTLSPLALVALVGCTTQPESQPKQPNILYIFPDQMRNHAMEFWGDEAYAGHLKSASDPVITPNLNQFASEGVVLSQAQSNFPLSSPHRAMLLTGTYPHKNGVVMNCNSQIPISNLNQEAICISDVLKKNNYQCAYFGKLHLDHPTKNNPQNPGTYVNNDEVVWDAYTPKERRHGFDHWYSYGTFDEHKNPHYWDNDGNRYDPHEYSPKHEADQVIEYLKSRANQEQPFFAMVSMNPPHSPYASLEDCMEEDYNLYKDKPLDELLVRPNLNADLQYKNPAVRYYFANITGIDREVGRILAALKELGLEENTLVVFSSDHGETMCSHVSDPKNYPYNEAMNVPFIIRYPQKLKHHVSPLLLSTADIMPTLLSLVGLEEEIPSQVQGCDLSSFLTQREDLANAPQGVLYLKNVEGEIDPQGRVTQYHPSMRGVKTEHYTLVYEIAQGGDLLQTYLFDQERDPYETHNLPLEEHPEVVEELTAQLATLLKESDDPWYQQRILATHIPY